MVRVMRNKIRRKVFTTIFCLVCNVFVFADKSLADNINNFNDFKTFEDLCENKDQVSNDIRHTVEELLLIARTSDCKIAAETLPKGKSLPLVKCQLTCPMTTINRHPYYWSAFSLIGNPW